MADNYLEKKMEDMRSGNLRKASKHSGGRKGEFEGLRAFVTGGASGIGRAIVEELRRNGATVDFCDIDTENGERLAKVYGAKFHKIDVSDTEAFSTLFSSLLEIGRKIDIVVNNVGVSDFEPLELNDVSKFEKILKTNLFPVFVTGNILARYLKETTGSDAGRIDSYGGRIINICSTRHLQSQPGSEGYAASKGGIFSLTHALMMSLAKYGVTVNCISPGWINVTGQTDFTEADKLQHPSGRVGIPEDIARMVAFLCRKENNFVNGQDIVIDGGMTRRMIYSDDDGWTFHPHE